MNTKILRIIARLNIGGPARDVVLLTEGLKYKGFENVLLCGEVAECEGNMMYFAEEKNIKPVIVKELSRELSIKNDWQVFWKIYRIICKERPNIIHTHTAKAGTLGRFAAVPAAYGGCPRAHPGAGRLRRYRAHDGQEDAVLRHEGAGL